MFVYFDSGSMATMKTLKSPHFAFGLCVKLWFRLVRIRIDTMTQRGIHGIKCQNVVTDMKFELLFYSPLGVETFDWALLGIL